MVEFPGKESLADQGEINMFEDSGKDSNSPIIKDYILPLNKNKPDQDNNKRKNLFDILGLKNRDSEIVLDEMSFKDDRFKAAVIRDDHPDIEKVYNLWYEVYIEEKGFPVNSRVKLDKKLYIEPKNNNIIAVLKSKDKVIGTLRFSDMRYNDLEFDYGKYLDKGKRIQEITKFIFSKNFRNRILSAFLMRNGNKFVRKKLPADFYGINSAINMINYYKRLGFSVVSEEVIHPVIGNVSCLLMADIEKLSVNIENIWKNIIGKE